MGFFISEVRSKKLFQLGWVLYIVGCVNVTVGADRENSRYISSVIPGLGLAGAATFGYFWELRLRWRPDLLRRICVATAAASILIMGVREWGRYQSIKRFYEAIPISAIHRIVVDEYRYVIRRPRDVKSKAPSLHIGSAAWHVPLVYLNVVLSDLRNNHRVSQGWEWENLPGNRIPCRSGDWRLTETVNLSVSFRTEFRKLNHLTLFPCPDRP